MSERTGARLRWTAAALIAVLLIGIGAFAAYLIMAPAESSSVAEAVSEPGDAATEGAPARTAPIGNASGQAPASPDGEVTLSPEAVTRAGIVVSPVGGSGSSSPLRIPATVQPNAYRSVTVTPIVGGRVTRVMAELGQHVRHGQPLADIYSPELMDAQTRYLSSRAELEAHEQALRRTERLVEIGAASRQELERIQAEHTAATTVVESHRARLTLLGWTEAHRPSEMTARDMNANASIVAPSAGTVTTRSANVGVNVEPTTPLFTIVDLSTVWIVGELYEQDFGRVQIGSAATVTTAVYPDLVIEGTVSYIDPQVKSETRTARVRVDVPNPNQQLRLGMFVEMRVGAAAQSSGAAIPRSAVQVVGEHTVIYLADAQQPGRFVEREVRLGETMGDQVQVLSGVQQGGRLVVGGSFSLRAERERLGLRPPTPSPTMAAAASTEGGGQGAASVQTARITVTVQTYQPDRITLRAGRPARLTFTRTSDQTCGTDIVIPSLNIKRALPLNQPVDIDFTPQQTGDMEFVCGMGMLRGTIVVQ